MLGKKNEETKEAAVETKEAAVETKAPEAPAASKGPKKAIDPKKLKAMKDETNEAHFAEGDEVKVKDLEFVVAKVSGLELVLKRKDFK